MSRAHPGDLLLEGLRSRWAGRLRSGLAVAGIAVGVLCLTLVSAVVDGLNRQVRTAVRSTLGQDVLILRREPSELRTLQQWKRFHGRPAITVRQFEEARNRFPSRGAFGAGAGTTASVHAAGETLEAVEVRGLSPEVPGILRYRLSGGRWFTVFDEDRARPVCVIGSEVAERLFGGRDPRGRSVEVLGRRTTVVGVAAEVGSVLGSSQDEWLALPLSTYLVRAAAPESLTLYASAPAGVEVAVAVEEVRSLVRRVRGLAPGEEDDFTIETAGDYEQIWSDLSGDVQRIALAVAAVASVVGGLVVLNVLLIDVAARRKEIGIRRAVGARRNEVLFQILLESILLTLAGAVLGTTAGAVLVWSMGSFVPVSLQIGTPGLLRVLAIALFVAVAAGIFPAIRAVRVAPIETLRDTG